jgi:hypothetical protein
MLVALALFCFGSSKYKRLPPSGSVVPTIIKGDLLLAAPRCRAAER